MSGLDFFVDLAMTGQVLGLDHTSDLATVRAVLGEQGNEISARRLLIDTGLVEFGWAREPRSGDWAVSHYGAQTHRLPRLAADGRVGAALVKRYGDFPAHLDIHELRAAFTAAGGALEERAPADAGHLHLWSPMSGISVVVAIDPAVTGERAGTVVKMLGPTGRGRLGGPSGTLSVDRN